MTQVFNAFCLHDERGIPLEMAYDMATSSGVQINLAAFACDALAAGWSEHKVERTIRAVKPDLDWREFRSKLTALWSLSGRLPDPECWRAMKKRLMS